MRLRQIGLWALALIGAALMTATPSLVLAQATVPSYVEQATGNTKAGVGVGILNGSGSATTPGVFLGYQQITSLSAATALSVPAGSTMATIRVSSQSVRYRLDGTNPTASIGMPVLVGETLFWTTSGVSLIALKFIEQAASATLDINYYK